MAKLFEQLTLRDVTIPNRAMIAPMCMYTAKDGIANDFHLVHLGRFALGGFGLVMVEATAVEARGRITHGDMGIWSDEHVAPLARIARFIKEHGSVPAIQLAHAGRKASIRRPWEGGGPIDDADGGWRVVGPSPVPYAEGYPTPHELSRDEIADVVAAFVRAAGRALLIGCQVAEIHAAHGYLLHEFLSPASNTRGDEYGGSFDNRIRMLVET